MKKLAILLVLLSSLVAKSQNYIPMPFEDGMMWRSFGALSVYEHYDEDRISGDTIIAGKVYKIVRRNSYSAPSTLTPYFPPYGTNFVRQDTLNKKVFLRLGSKDTLLYDFNLQVGDTIHGIMLGYLQNAGIDTIRIATIDSIPLNGVFHKRFISTRIYDLYTPLGNTYGYIEGIGGGGFLSTSIGFERALGIVCVGKYYNQTLYPDSLFECIYPTLTQDYQFLHPIQLYPNPSSEVLHIHAGEAEFEVRVSDVFGNILLANKSYQENSTMDISSFPVGMYAVKLVMKNGVVMNRKFVKE